MELLLPAGLLMLVVSGITAFLERDRGSCVDLGYRRARAALDRAHRRHRPRRVR